MNVIFAVFLYISILFSIMQNFIWLSLILVLIFSFRYGAVALIPLAIVIDGYFGNFYHVPILSILAVVWYVLVEYLQPRIVNFQAK